MTVADIDLYRYELPLSDPLQVGTSTVKHREGLLLRLTTENGRSGWGDAAPLPGFSDETLADVVERAQSFASRWAGASISLSTESLDSSLHALPFGQDEPCSLRFAVESAVVALHATAREVPLPTVLGPSRSTVSLNALIAHPLKNVREEAARLRDAGYRAVKVKVGRGDVSAEAERVREIDEELGEAAALRLDANRAWSLEAAIQFAEALRGIEVAYLEEPLSDPGQLRTFAAQTGLPVALDETTREVGPEVLRNGHPASAVVLKPTLLGGIRTTQQWMGAALENGVTPVLSAAYESGIGLRMLVALAATGPDVSVGLSTYERLAADVLASRLPLGGPTAREDAVTVPDVRVNWSRLDPVTDAN